MTRPGNRFLRETIQHELVMERAAAVLLRLYRSQGTRFEDVEQMHAELVWPQAHFENLYFDLGKVVDAQVMRKAG